MLKYTNELSVDQFSRCYCGQRFVKGDGWSTEPWAVTKEAYGDIHTSRSRDSPNLAPYYSYLKNCTHHRLEGA